MDEITLNNWEEFEIHLAQLSIELDQLRERSRGYVSSPLFRGHSAANWKLETTLDRTARFIVSVEEYYNRVRAVKPAVVSLTGKEWPLPDQFDRHQNPHMPPQGYEFMIYLRHHGFPSPLLDWSRSPYVAAYFAFHSNDETTDQNVAIYSYVEFIGKAKSRSGGEPHIVTLGPYVVSHKRHYTQQCEYTMCTNGAEPPSERDYAKHEDVAQQSEPNQDQLRKYVIPRSERRKVMDRLGLMNITAFSLFGSEESLMETLAYTEIEKSILGKAPKTP